MAIRYALEHHPLDPHRVLIVGAGNGNDVDIAYLEQTFSEIVLLDIDPSALKRFMQRVTKPDRFKQVVLDITGIEELLPNLKAMGEREIIDFLNTCRPEPNWSHLSGPFDLILGCNYATQMLIPTFMLLNNSGGTSSTYRQCVLELHTRVLERIFEQIQALLQPKGLYIHSTDLFDLSIDNVKGTSSPVTRPILNATQGDLDRVSAIQPILQMLIRQGQAIGGSSLPPNCGKLFDGCHGFYYPWTFENSDSLMKVYIVSVTVLQRK